MFALAPEAKKILSLCFFLLLIGFVACVPPKPQDLKTDKEVYLYGLKLFQKGDYTEAVKFFEEVQRNYALGPYVADASYYLALSYFQDDKDIEAADALNSFVKLYPNHAQAAAARYYLAQAYERQIPGTVDRDQTSTHQALQAYQQYLAQTPNGGSAKEAAAKVRELKEQLAKRELYVARFYIKRKQYPAALGRLKNVIATYPEAELDGEDLYYLGYAQMKLEEPQAARLAFEQYLKRYPQGSRRGAVEDFLAQLPRAGKEGNDE